jgi:hypothetical protein
MTSSSHCPAGTRHSAPRVGRLRSAGWAPTPRSSPACPRSASRASGPPPHGHHAGCTLIAPAAGCLGNMTGSDLLILAPWLVLAAALVVMGVKLRRSRRSRR